MHSTSPTPRRRFASCLWLLLALVTLASARADDPLRVALGEIDITPRVGAGFPDVWLAGYGPGRRATEIHDPLMARAVLLDDGTRRIALVSVDLVGVQYPVVEAIRKQLPDWDYVLVSSTHNHEGPDVIGIWGRSPLQSGAEPAYLKFVEQRVVKLVRQVSERMEPATARYGIAQEDALVGDSRLPIVKDGVMRVLSFHAAGDPHRMLGLLVQWNCHPEAMGSRNTRLTADFPAATVERLRGQLDVPVAYFTGAVGGLMAPPREGVLDDDGADMPRGTFEYTWRYGALVADLALRALKEAQPARLTPFRFRSERIAMRVDNPLYRTAWTAGVLKRPATIWAGDPRTIGAPLKAVDFLRDKKMAVVTETACLDLGEVRVACIPGELYPELVYGGVPDPAEKGADFPEAEIEPLVERTLATKKWLLLGLANDEIGYLIPKRQWDHKAPYCYGRESSQYGEINSCSPDAARIVLDSLARVAAELNQGSK